MHSIQQLIRHAAIAARIRCRWLKFTISSWSRFNRLLKPVNEGGGIMVHAFPSLLHHDFDHWAIQIRSHTCLFSAKSLRFLCERTGFKLIRGVLPRPVGPHDHAVMIFRKISDLA
jgi:hypothetical protein